MSRAQRMAGATNHHHGVVAPETEFGCAQYRGVHVRYGRVLHASVRLAEQPDRDPDYWRIAHDQLSCARSTKLRTSLMTSEIDG